MKHTTSIKEKFIQECPFWSRVPIMSRWLFKAFRRLNLEQRQIEKNEKLIEKALSELVKEIKKMKRTTNTNF